MEFQARSFELFDKQWALLTAGTEGNFNTMTIGWGGLGTLWGKPVATVYVKPIRYTHRFMEENEYFTVSFYPANCRRALSVCGSLSGRDGDKIGVAGLHPRFLGRAVTFLEAEKTLVLRKLYRQDLDLNAIPADVKSRYYVGEPPHTFYVGEVVEILRHPELVEGAPHYK